MIFVTWYIVKLELYVTVCSDFLITIVANDVSRLGRKMISWICIVGEVSMTSSFSDHKISKFIILDPRKTLVILKIPGLVEVRSLQSGKTCRLKFNHSTDHPTPPPTVCLKLLQRCL